MTLETELTAMPDITDRLRATPRSDIREVMSEAADEIERLREAILRHLAEQDATLSVQGGSVTVTMDATLTDAEREAVEAMAHWCEVDCGYCRDADEQRAADHYAARAATLRGLLERTK